MLSDTRKLLRVFQLPKPVDALVEVYGMSGVHDMGYVVTIRGKLRLTAKGRVKAVSLLRKVFNCWLTDIREGKKF